MTTVTTTTELLRMSHDELRRELKAKRFEAAKVRLALSLGSEKNHAQYKGMKSEIARMQMVLDTMGKSTKSSMSTKKTTNSSISSGNPSQSAKKTVKRSGSSL